MRGCCGLVSIIVSLLLLLDVVNSKLTDQAIEALRRCNLDIQKSCHGTSNNKTIFNLYTRWNIEKSQLVDVREGRDNLPRTLFDPRHPNKVIIHGINPHLYKSDLVSIKNAYLARQEANVWMVDWSLLARGNTCALMSVHNADHVAHCVAHLITAINRRAARPDIHVVSDRFGSRVVHLLAQAIAPLRLTRITGLNPVGNTVPAERDNHRLSPWDADFVDTIHTSPFLPKTEMFGHTDFYVNPGSLHQPGCDKAAGKFVCDQRKAIQYFAESISTNVGFIAWECPGYSNFILGTCNPESSPEIMMGDTCPIGSSGIYITYTANESPYALGSLEGERFREKGPKMRSDMIATTTTTLKRNLELLSEKTPEIIKDLGVVDTLRSMLDERKEELKTTAINFGVQGVKSIASQIMKKKN